MHTGIIQFQGSSFTTAKDEITGIIYLAIKPFIEAMGLSWKAQKVKLNSDDRFQLKEIDYQTNGGIQKMLSLATDHLPAYLYSINPNKVKEELKSRIIAFQSETFEVINSYWREKFQNREVSPKDNFQKRKEQFQFDVIALESSFKLLRINEASKILMTKTLYTEHGLSTSYLPKYSDEQHTYSLSHLLKKFEVGISAKKLNLILLSENYLEIKTRKSTGSLLDEETKEKKPKLRTFKSLTEKGLEFGKNVISPHNQLETSPHYFESKFSELITSLKL